MSFPINSVNVTDLTIQHLDLSSLSLNSISLDNITAIGFIHNIYVLGWLLFTFIFIQTGLVAFLVVYTYRKDQKHKKFTKFNAEFLDA